MKFNLFKKGNNETETPNNNNDANNTNEPAVQIGDDEGQIVKEKGYFRFQKDNQVVIERNEEQQRIYDEYFVVKNYETTTWDPSLKKKAKLFKTLSVVFLALAIALFLIIGLAAGSLVAGIIVGVIFAAVGGVLVLLSNKAAKKFEESVQTIVAPKKLLSDAEYEELVNQRIEEMNIREMSLDKLGLDPDQVKEIQPIILKDKTIKDHSFTVRNREDKSLHSSTQSVMYLFFTDEQLFVYKVIFDMCCNMQEEWASEFFYKDICDVRSYTKRNILEVGDLKVEYSSVAFKIVTSNSEIGFDMAGDNERTESIQAMKQKIREKKSQ